MSSSYSTLRAHMKPTGEPSSQVLLTALADADAPLLHAWRQDPAVADGTLGYPFPTSLEAERDWIRSFAPRGTPTDLCFGIRESLDGPLLGYAQLRGIDWLARCAEFGIVIGDQRERGRGLGRAAVLAIFDYSFGKLRLERLWLRVAAFNEMAERLYRNLGFIEEGRLRHHAFRNGSYHDVIIFGILHDETISPGYPD